MSYQIEELASNVILGPGIRLGFQWPRRYRVRDLTTDRYIAGPTGRVRWFASEAVAQRAVDALEAPARTRPRVVRSKRAAP